MVELIGQRWIGLSVQLAWLFTFVLSDHIVHAGDRFNIFGNIFADCFSQMDIDWLLLSIL